MIPLSFREKINYVDEDGLNWVFRPKTGKLERDLLALNNMPEDVEKQTEFIDRIFAQIFVSVTDPKKRYKDLKSAEEAADVMTATEKMQMLGVWGKANAMTTEEKKS